MKKNYYELLEIDRNASPEIIEKAYKTLVKKYHPDLQSESVKSDYEEILKQINEAYEILSDEDKKRIYDLSIQTNTISQEAYDKLNFENNRLKNELNNLKTSHQQQPLQNSSYSNSSNNNKQFNFNEPKNQQNYDEEMKKAINKAYYDAYIQDLKRRGFKIKYKKTKKDYLTLFFSIVIIIFLFILLWQIPSIRNYFIDIYNNNPIIKYFVNIFIHIFKKST